MNDESIGRKLAKALGHEAAELGRRHAGRLAAARREALAAAAGPNRRKFLPLLVPAAAGMALLLLFALQVNRGGLPAGIEGGDLEILASAAGPELLEEMDFYAWIAESRGELK